MAFHGIRNTEGRKVGSVNRVTKQTKEAVSDIIEGNLSEFQSRLNNLSDSEYCKIYLSLMKFVVPTMRSIDAPNIKNELPFQKVEIEILKNDNKPT
mgnify:CR=1 FL=1